MSIPEWVLSALSSSILILVVGWLCRQLIATRLKASVQHEFDQKLEAIRTDLRKSEETFKADLRAKEDQIAALQSGALAGMASRQAALDKRRLEAIDQLWAGVETLTPFKLPALWLQTFDFVKALKESSDNPTARKLFLDFAPNLSIQSFPKVDVHRARPFVSDMAWALFSAYRAILGYATVQLYILRMGQEELADLLDPNTVHKLILVALPHYSDYIEKHNDKAYPYIVEPLEAALLEELQRMLSGEESDKKSVEQAAKIMQEVKIVNEAISQGSKTQS